MSGGCQVNTAKLSEFRDGAKKTKKKVWTAPVIDQFRAGQIIAWDQSLSACGMVALWCTKPEDGRTVLHINSAETFRMQTAIGGHEGNFQRTLALSDEIGRWMEDRDFGGGWEVVHEAPPSGGGTMRHPESSILASVAVRQGTRRYKLNPMVSRQSHARFACGNGNATKKDHHAALMKLAEDLEIGNLHLITNEAKRDALSVALHWLGS